MSTQEAFKLRYKILEIIHKEWPCNITHIIKALGLKEDKKNLLRIRYHVLKLAKEGKILTKRIDRALVCWPTEVEKLRVIQELIK